MKRAGAAICSAFLLLTGAACDDEDVDEAREEIEDRAEGAREEVEDAVGEAGARVAAEAMRGLLLRDDPSERHRVTVLQDAADDVPGDAQVTGIEDTDGDGIDDDGQVGVAVGDQESCLRVDEGGDIDISLDSC